MLGVVIFDGSSFSYHKIKLPGDSNRIINIVPKDAHHVWLSTSTSGLYTVNTDTLAAQRVIPPRKGIFKSVLDVFKVRGDWYVVD